MNNVKFIIILIMLSFVFASCKSDKNSQPTLTESDYTSNNYIEVVAKDFTFTVADSIPSGWSTFRMENTGMMDHFFLLTKLPDSLTLDDYLRDVAGAFGVAWEALKENKPKEEAFKLLGENLPPWYANAKAMGGTGLISGGETAINTLKLEPGYYVMECYVKTQNGQFHTELGMINSLIVTSEITTDIPPEANAEIILRNEDMVFNGEIFEGMNTFAVHFEEQPPFGLGNDIHIIKVSDSTNMDIVTQWMDWSNIKGLTSPGPATFIGGTQEMPVGYTSYFKCNLVKGDYAFVSEVPIGRFKKFKIE